MGLLKKKPGGTFVGNLVRGVVNKATHGILGNGAGILPRSEAPVGSPPVYVKPTVQEIATQKSIDNAKDAITGALGEMPVVKRAIAAGIWDKYKIAIIGGAVAIVGLITFLAMRKRKPRSKRF